MMTPYRVAFLAARSARTHEPMIDELRAAIETLASGAYEVAFTSLNGVDYRGGRPPELCTPCLDEDKDPVFERCTAAPYLSMWARACREVGMPEAAGHFDAAANLHAALRRTERDERALFEAKLRETLVSMLVAAVPPSAAMNQHARENPEHKVARGACYEASATVQGPPVAVMAVCTCGTMWELRLSGAASR